MCPESRAAAGEEGQGICAKLASVDILGFPRCVARVEGTKRIQLEGRHRLPRMAGELSSAIAGTSPTASLSYSNPIGVAREAFIFAF